MQILKNKRILVTGGESMIGGEISDLLEAYDNQVNRVPHEYYDLLSYEDTWKLFRDFRPHLVVHCATYSGNLQFNTLYPYDTFYRTTQMALNVFSQCQYYKPEKVLSILSSCAYPNIDNVEIKEDDLWRGLPHHTIESHGLAKRNLDSLSRMLRQQYGVNAVTCVLSNSFGPRDSFQVEKTKVLGSFIKKFIEAKENKTIPIMWGQGIAKRELIYSKDAAKLLVRALEVYDGITPINIGTPHEVTIRELATQVAAAVGYLGEIQWTPGKPEGQLRKKLDLSIMNKTLFHDWDFKYTNFSDAVKETVDWYLKNKDTWTK
jgi:GDP-L-fucose synthase